MALYFLSASVVSRGRTGLPTTRNAVAAASYNARERLFDERQGIFRDMAAEATDLIRADILLPEFAPVRWLNRETLWNEVEASERRLDAQVARSIVFALPRDLSLEENSELARDFMARGFVRHGMVADIAVHMKEAQDGKPQPHAHALLTMRRASGDGFGLKERAWNTAAALVSWRSTWAAMVNERLAASGSTARVTHLAQRGSDWIGRAVPALRAHLERETARARHVVRLATPIVVAAWRRVTDWAERRREPMSEQDVVDQLREAMWKRGLRPAGDPVLDGKWHRVAVEGDTGRKASGSYIAYPDGRPGGFIQNFKTGEHGSWRAGGTYIADPKKLAATQERRRDEREATMRSASDRARLQWERSAPAKTHAYLERKGVSGAGAKVSVRGDLLIPMRDADGRLWGIQTITPSGEKFFPKGGRISGTHALIGTPEPGKTVVVVEGWATAKTVHEETGLVVAVAFNAGNLEHVARAYKERGSTIVVASDNDHALPLRSPPLPNVGAEKGAGAASATGGRVIVPTFSLGDVGTDWNDYAHIHGKGAVRRAFEREGIPMGDTKEESAVQAETTQAQRDAARQVVPLLAQAAVNADLQAQQASQRAQVEATRAHSAAVSQ